jgi:peptidoglycan/LPS O-acetylase OafA/YrhL
VNNLSPDLNDSYNGRLRELDGWRAVSVLLVVIHHIAGYQHARMLSRFPGLTSVVHYMGPLGVSVFFVISGFVICRLLISEEKRYGSVSLKSFYCRRACRILPPLCFYLLALSLLLCVGLIHEDRRAIFGAALFLRDLPIGPKSWFVGHTWSLAVEEQFYLIFPTAWVIASKERRSQIFFATYFLCVAWNLYVSYTDWNPLASRAIWEGFACISCGVMIAIHEGRVRKAANGIPLFFVALVALVLLVHPIDSKSWQTTLFECLFVPPAIGLVLFSSMERKTWLQKLLCCRPLQAIGVTSYGVYLWQQLFTAPVRGNFSRSGEIITSLLPILCLVVPLSYFLVEKPAIRYGKQLSQRMRKASSGLKLDTETMPFVVAANRIEE